MGSTLAMLDEPQRRAKDRTKKWGNNMDARSTHSFGLSAAVASRAGMRACIHSFIHSFQ